MLVLLAATDVQAWCRQVLAEHCLAARQSLDRVRGLLGTTDAGAALTALIDFVALAS